MVSYRSPPRPFNPSSLSQRLLLDFPLLVLLIVGVAFVLLFLSFSSLSSLSTWSSVSKSSSMSRSSSQLLAINICLLPPSSHPIYKRAHRLQSLMQSAYPSEYVFSSTRYAHVTLVQSYIERSSLPSVLAAVKAALTQWTAAHGPLTLTMKRDLVPGPVQEGMLVPSIATPPTPSLESLHSALVAAVHPFRVPSSTPVLASLEERKAAFYREAGEVEIGRSIVDYVVGFEERSAGPKYYPHVSLGVVDEASWLKVLQAEAEAEKNAGQTEAQLNEGWTVDRVHVFQLGDWGTVRQQLEELPLQR